MRRIIDWPECSIPGCTKPQRTRKWCKMHYTRWSRHGDPLAVECFTDAEAAFSNRTRLDGSCLVWTGFRNSRGYGHITVSGKKVYAHRYAWSRINGEIDDGLVIDHICHNPGCVNIDHLRLATQAQNGAYRLGPAIPNTASGIRNVYPCGKRWAARVSKDGKLHTFGTFDTIKEASQVSAAARLEMFGEFAGSGGDDQ